MCSPGRQTVWVPRLAAFIAAAALVVHAQESNDFLGRGLGLSDLDLRALARGDAVAKSLEAGDSHDVAAAGVVRVQMTPDFFVERFRDIVRFKSAEAVLQIGTFSVPPRVEDLAALEWEADDLWALRSCRVGDCGVRLSAEAIGRFQREVDWAASDEQRRAADLFNAVLVELVNAYLREGDSALGAYHDRQRAINLREEFLAVATQSPSPLDLVPEFREYLVAFPRVAISHVESFLYWSKERIGSRPVVSLTHVAIYRPPAPNPVKVIIGSRQIYASHYFESSLGLTTMLEPADGAASTGSFDLLYLNRSRTDRLGGFLGLLTRPIVRSRTRGTMERYLPLLKARLEREFRGTDPSP